MPVKPKNKDPLIIRSARFELVVLIMKWNEIFFFLKKLKELNDDNDYERQFLLQDFGNVIKQMDQAKNMMISNYEKFIEGDRLERMISNY